MKPYGDNMLLTSSADHSLSLWSATDGRLLHVFRGHTEPIVWFDTLGRDLVSLSSGNRILLHPALDAHDLGKDVVPGRLRPDTVRGTPTAAALLPLNRQLLVATDTGVVTLLA